MGRVRMKIFCVSLALALALALTQSLTCSTPPLSSKK